MMPAPKRPRLGKSLDAPTTPSLEGHIVAYLPDVAQGIISHFIKKRIPEDSIWKDAESGVSGNNISKFVHISTNGNLPNGGKVSTIKGKTRGARLVPGNDFQNLMLSADFENPELIASLVGDIGGTPGSLCIPVCTVHQDYMLDAESLTDLDGIEFDLDSITHIDPTGKETSVFL
jgi:hypothetical protein